MVDEHGENSIVVASGAKLPVPEDVHVPPVALPPTIPPNPAVLLPAVRYGFHGNLALLAGWAALSVASIWLRPLWPAAAGLAAIDVIEKEKLCDHAARLGADSLERLAAEHLDPAALDTAARALKLPIGQTGPVQEGTRVLLGTAVIPDAGVWAFQAKVGETSPVIDGEAVFTAEYPWQPSTQPDPQYHYDHINSALKKAAAHMPRVDAIGGSSAGVIASSRAFSAAGRTSLSMKPRISSRVIGAPRVKALSCS